MPRLIAQNDIRLEWSDIAKRVSKRKPRSADIRSSGVHLSGIIKYVLTTAGLMKTFNDEQDEMPLRMGVGMAWEEWSVGLWPDICWQPGELEADGVFMSPDGVSEGDEGLSVEEWKATWKSENTYGTVIDQPLWMYQLMGYCKAMNCILARMHILWVNGNYRPPSPKYMTYTIRFTQEEIDQFWENIVLKNKDHAVREEH